MSRISERPIDAPALPKGRVTFLFTDLEGSSGAWERRPDETRKALHYHDLVSNDVIGVHGGVLIKHTGDGIKAVFTSSEAAVAAAVALQQQFQVDRWNGVQRMKVRIGLHAGEAEPDGDDYYGGVINRAARVADVANGDQIAATDAVLGPRDPASDFDVRFVDCGLFSLKGCGLERIHLVEADGLIVDDRPLRSRRALAGSALPPELGQLVGRGKDVDRVVRFLTERRLVSIVGLGGVGKTRLAIAAARQEGPKFTNGVVYCPLAPIEAGGADRKAAVLSSIAGAVGARRQPGQDLLESLANFIDGRDVLVVLDNCEHVLPEVRTVVEQILSVDGPTVLVTSREPINVAGEQRVNLLPLAVESAGVDLLVERATERDPEFDRGGHEATLREISRRLDGIPLAIELAAARLRIMHPERLLDGLRLGPKILSSADSSPNRQLHAALAWSINQLSDREQSILEGLCVFSGDFTLDAVAAVLPIDDEITLLDDLGHLAELSLIKNHPGQGEIRFSLLETVRQFGIERLQLRDAAVSRSLRAAHARYYAELVADCGQNLMSPSEGEIWTRIDASSDNIRVAFDHLVAAHNHDAAAEMIVDLAWFSVFAMRMEPFTWARQLVELPEQADSADLWAVRAIGEYLSADESAPASAERSLALDPRDPTGLANTVLASVGLNNTFDPQLSGTATAAMLDVPSDRFREKRIAGLALRSFHLCLLDPNQEAVEMANQAVREATETGSASALTFALWAKAVANLRLDWPTSDAATRQGLAMAESLTSNHIISHLINGLSVHFAALTGEVSEAALFTASEITSTMDEHYLVGASHLLGAASVILCRAGRPHDGAALLGAMISNGHRPRREIRAAVEAALNGDLASLESGSNWSINEAGERAVAWLTEVGHLKTKSGC